jgi:hypothetical protein
MHGLPGVNFTNPFAQKYQSKLQKMLFCFTEASLRSYLLQVLQFRISASNTVHKILNFFPFVQTFFIQFRLPYYCLLMLFSVFVTNTIQKLHNI